MSLVCPRDAYERGFAQCHASTVARLPNGDVFCAYFAGTREMDPDTAIFASVRSKGNWGSPKLLAKVCDIAHWNPVAFVDPRRDRMHLFFKVGETPREWRTWVMTQDLKDGVWTDPKPLVKDPCDLSRGPVRSRPVVLADGTWLAPSSYEKRVGWQTGPSRRFPGMTARLPVEIWDSFVDRSEDGGKTWTKGDLIPYDRSKHGEYGGIIQPTLWESSPGNVHMLLRSTTGRTFRSDSCDGGRTWSPAEPTRLPNPNSGVDVARRQDGLLCLAYNPVEGNWAERTPISVAFSTKGGTEWSEAFDIEGGHGSFSYPSLDASGPTFLLTYTRSRFNIAFVEFEAPDMVDFLESNGRPYVRVLEQEDDHGED